MPHVKADNLEIRWQSHPFTCERRFLPWLLNHTAAPLLQSACHLLDSNGWQLQDAPVSFTGVGEKAWTHFIHRSYMWCEIHRAYGGCPWVRFLDDTYYTCHNRSVGLQEKATTVDMRWHPWMHACSFMASHRLRGKTR